MSGKKANQSKFFIQDTTIKGFILPQEQLFIEGMLS